MGFLNLLRLRQSLDWPPDWLPQLAFVRSLKKQVNNKINVTRGNEIGKYHRETQTGLVDLVPPNPSAPGNLSRPLGLLVFG